MERILDAGLLFLHLALGRSADVDLGHAPGELGESLLEFFAVVIARGILDLAANLLDPGLDVARLAGALNDRRVVLVDDHLLGAAEFGQAEILELHSQVLEHRRGSGEDRNVLEHRLAAIAVARSLDRTHLEGAAEPVDHQRGQGFAVDVLGDDQERLAGVHHGLQQRHDVFDARDFLLEHQDVAILEHALHLRGIGDEVGGKVAAVELHPLHELDLRLEALALVDRDHAVLAHLVHRLGEQFADLGVVVRGDRSDLRHLLLALHRNRHLLEPGDDVGDGLLDASLHLDRVHAGDHGLEALVEDRLGKHGGRGGAVTRHVARLAGNFADHPGAHVFVDVLEVDLLGDGDAVLGDRRRAEALLEDHVAALGAERHLHRPREFGDAASHRLTGLLIECHHLGHVKTPLGICGL